MTNGLMPRYGLAPRPRLRARPAPRGWGARLLSQPEALAGLALTSAFVLLAVGSWQFAPFDPKVAVARPLLAPSPVHWFGTDDLGRDVLSNVVHGTRASLLVGTITTLTSFVIGTAAGLSAGYFGGLVDDAIMRLAEAFQLLPRFFLALLLVAFFGSSIWLLALVLGLTFWPSTARLLRAQVLSLRQRDFVLAARALGARDRRVMLRHVLPNALAPVLGSVSWGWATPRL